MLEWLLLIGIGSAFGATLVTLLGRRRTHAVAGEIWDDLASELERARRYGRSFQLARISGDPHAPRAVDTPAGIGVRRTDRAWQLGADLYVLLPESETTGCDGWTRRLQRETGIAPHRVRTACFPDDGLTLDALLDLLADPELAPREVPRPTRATAESLDSQTQVAS
jgi:hypothetical protein